jgi:hypothetical protein
VQETVQLGSNQAETVHTGGENGEILTTAKKIDEMDDEMLLW